MVVKGSRMGSYQTPKRKRTSSGRMEHASLRVRDRQPGRAHPGEMLPTEGKIWAAVHVGGCLNYGPLLGLLNARCRILPRTTKGTIILTTTHVQLPQRSLQHVPSLTGSGGSPLERLMIGLGCLRPSRSEASANHETLTYGPEDDGPQGPQHS